MQIEIITIDIRGERGAATNSTDVAGSSSLCIGDYLQFSGNMARYCNENTPPQRLLYFDRAVTIQFVSDATIAGVGFQLKYRALCAQTLRPPGGNNALPFNGTIRSPNLNAPATSAFRCLYRIVTNPTTSVRVRFTSIGLKTYTYACLHPDLKNATEDYIEVLNVDCCSSN